MKEILFQSHRVSYSLTGSGPAVMMVHGFGEDHHVFDNVSTLNESYTLILPDLPGSGKSAMIGTGSDKDFLKLESYADLLNEILLKENAEQCVLIGHSMGGYIALAFAEKYPEKLLGFGLFHSSAFADDEEKKKTRLKAIEFIHDKGADQFLKTSTPNLFSKSFTEHHQNVVNEFIDRYSGFSAEALSGYYFAMIARPDRTDILKNFPGPVLFIIGEEDNAIPFSASLSQCHLPKQAHVNLLPLTGHMGMIEHPGECIKFIRDYLLCCFIQNV